MPTRGQFAVQRTELSREHYASKPLLYALGICRQTIFSWSFAVLWHADVMLLNAVLVMQRHLIPGVLQEHGLGQDQLVFPSGALQLIADGYTREASYLLAYD